MSKDSDSKKDPEMDGIDIRRPLVTLKKSFDGKRIKEKKKKD